MTARILVAEDDRKQADLIRRYLERAGHRATVVHDGRAAVSHARKTILDLVILDLMLPVMSGFDVCRELRSDRDIPIIMLTARVTEDDMLRGLALGADDYLTKPYSPRELVARVQAVLRRTVRAHVAESERYRVGELSVDIGRHEVHVGGTSVHITPAEFALLSCLASAPGRVFTRDLLLERTGGFQHDATGRAIDMHVLNLRRKIEEVPSRPRYLLTVHGVGYKLAAPETSEDPDNAS
ncbi:response regulator transcription factor [Nocardia pneumoniae]|uniref:response regulator transcription factor n=1 Tax=Nocardia pneumoniae TaxID=228601 RepID=UPI000A30E1C5|nr:response regulator transcription factor [Nocardia pneumoniae]